MAKTSGGVRKDRIRCGVDLKKTMHRLIKTYGEKNRERIYRAARYALNTLSKNTGYDKEALMINPTLSDSTLRRRKRAG